MSNSPETDLCPNSQASYDFPLEAWYYNNTLLAKPDSGRNSGRSEISSSLFS
jgi:hypothetical protein